MRKMRAQSCRHLSVSLSPALNELFEKLEDLFWKGKRIEEDEKLTDTAKERMIREIESQMLKEFEDALCPAELVNSLRWDEYIFTFRPLNTDIALEFNFAERYLDILWRGVG